MNPLGIYSAVILPTLIYWAIKDAQRGAKEHDAWKRGYREGLTAASIAQYKFSIYENPDGQVTTFQMLHNSEGIR